MTAKFRETVNTSASQMTSSIYIFENSWKLSIKCPNWSYYLLRS